MSAKLYDAFLVVSKEKTFENFSDLIDFVTTFVNSAVSRREGLPLPNRFAVADPFVRGISLDEAKKLSEEALPSELYLSKNDRVLRITKNDLGGSTRKSKNLSWKSEVDYALKRSSDSFLVYPVRFI
jgi:hypothetical protein